MANRTLTEVVGESILQMRSTPINEVVENELGVDETSFMEAVTESFEDAAPVADAHPAAAFAAGLLVGKRFAEWGGE
jgi:hypothetical protein